MAQYQEHPSDRPFKIAAKIRFIEKQIKTLLKESEKKIEKKEEAA